MNKNLLVVKLRSDAKLPTKAHATDLGYDLYSVEDVTILPTQTAIISTGIACSFPDGYGALIRDRSSVATKLKLFTVAGVIDNGYTGEIKIALYNSTGFTATVSSGEKIAQMILIPIYPADIIEVYELPETDRGEKGFGSSGK